MSVALITAIYGEYDEPNRLPEGFDLDEAVLVSDGRVDAPDGYRHVVLPREWLHPRMAGKLPRCRPDLFTGCDASLWVDGAFAVRPGLMPAISAMLAASDWWQPEHPDRNCLADEALFCTLEPGAKVKYDDWPLVEQADHYLHQGMPRNWGLWATGIILRRHTDLTRTVGETWHNECLRWSVQDQLSHPYAAWLHDVRPSKIVLDGSLLYNQWAAWTPHRGG